MDWSEHVDSFLSQWITRYVDPSTSQWKDLLDHMLLRDKQAQPKYPEGRGILFSRLSKGEKYDLLRTIPKRASYVKDCIRAHFKLGLAQHIDPEEVSTSLPAEPLWRNHRFTLPVDRPTMKYYHLTLNLRQLVDIIHPRTRRIRTADQWRALIKRKDTAIRTWAGHRAEHTRWPWATTR